MCLQNALMEGKKAISYSICTSWLSKGMNTILLMASGHSVCVCLWCEWLKKKTCIQLLTPSLPWCHWKMTNKSAKFETFKLLSSFSHWHVKGFSSKRAALQADVSYDPKIYCVQACLCIFQPGNFTGWGSDGVSNCNSYNENLYWLGMLQWHFLFKLCNSNMITSVSISSQPL